MQERRVLVPYHFAADARRFENQHGLQQQRLGQTGADREFSQSGLTREGIEHRVEIVQGMADFVERVRFVLA